MYRIEYNAYRNVKSFNKRVCFLILHYSSRNFQNSIDDLTEGDVSTHYLVPDPDDPTYQNAGYKEVTLFNLVDENDRAWHAGESNWKTHSGLNDTSLGIEIVYIPVPEGSRGLKYPEFNAQQINAIIKLCENIVQRYPNITPKCILGHADISYSRKSDPGPKFPWKKLYDAGIGAWWDDENTGTYDTYDKYKNLFDIALPPEQDIKDKFSNYGYFLPPNLDSAEYKKLIRAFQMHFRQSNYDGVMDSQTCAILYTLVEKYGSFSNNL